MDKNTFYTILIQRYKNKTATDQELAAFFQLIREGKLDETLIDEMDRELCLAVQPAKVHRTVARYYVMAAVLLAGIVVAAVLLRDTRVLDTPQQAAAGVGQDVPAGGNRARLTMPDGSTITLDDADIGAVAEHGGLRVDKTEDGQLVFQLTEGEQQTAMGKSVAGFHEISTPRGGQYRVVLPDGSTAWLNADSKLRLSSGFTGHNREVFLQGEGFFDVKPGANPFVVHTNGQRVLVLGTQFNVKAYPEETATLTTLLEGRVNIGVDGSDRFVALKPNQQSVLDNRTKNVQVSDVAAEDFLAWKAGFFTYRNTPLASVMQDVARWYDVSVDVSLLPDKKLYGVLPRDVSLVTLLDMIAMTSGVKFGLEERRIYLQE